MTKYTKWIPLHAYENATNAYLVQCRQNIKTGFIDFKTVKIANSSFFINLNLKAGDQFELLTKLK